MKVESSKKTPALTAASKVSDVVAIVQSAGLLKSAQSFECHYSQGDEYDPREMVGIKFAVLGTASADMKFCFVHLYFWGDGAIELLANPNRRSPWRMECTLMATYPEPLDAIEKMIAASLDVVASTLNLYATSVPMSDYSPLLEVWKTLKPKLLDTGEEPADAQVESPPWWRFWSR